MSDRLTELQRQRALIQGHLAWLDQEIVAATGKPAMRSDFPLPAVKPVETVPMATAAVEPLADELIAKFGAEPKGTVQDARKGCVLWFIFAMVLLGLGIYGLILHSRSLHAHDTPPVKKPALESTETR